VFFGDPETAFDQAADLSANAHIHTVVRPCQRVLSLLPQKYDDLWGRGEGYVRRVCTKGMYKVEPVVAEGGEVIVYGPHISELSRSHGTLFRRIGYHVRDYFLAQRDQFKVYPWGILAHSTHLRGSGAYFNSDEQPRIQVTLATGISEEVSREVNLGYHNPSKIDVDNWVRDQDAKILVVPHAGEMLYRLAM
jgi:nickel-dependent lactate racemase